jgi:CheY-like chemotaxis protein
MTKPEEIKVAIFEDDKTYQDILKMILEEMGVSVVLLAATMDEAVAAIPTLEKKGVTHVFLDGNLSPGTSGEDGVRLNEKIKQQAPAVLTVGLSANDQPYVDVPLGKTEYYKDNALKSALGLLDEV